MALIALAEEKAAAAAGDGDEVFGLEVDFEPEGLDVIVAAGGDFAHAEHRSHSAERCAIWHSVVSLQASITRAVLQSHP